MQRRHPLLLFDLIESQKGLISELEANAERFKLILLAHNPMLALTNAIKSNNVVLVKELLSYDECQPSSDHLKQAIKYVLTGRLKSIFVQLLITKNRSFKLTQTYL